MSTLLSTDKSFPRPTAVSPAPHAVNLLGNRERFLKACRCESVGRPPIWLMRQAGRALPEYRELKKKYTFVQLVQNPELATEVTLQPIRRFDFDAAILFSDILVISEALGQKYEFRDTVGISMEFLLETHADVDRLELGAVTQRLQYVADALRLIKKELAGKTALIGFSGSPWTLANFMIEGGGVKEYSKAKALFYSEPKLFSKLMGTLTSAITNYLNMQIEAGAEAVQIFDSMGGLLSDGSFEAASGKWIKEIVQGLKGRVPVIVFAKGTHGNWNDLVQTGAQVLGVDWNVSLAATRRQLPANVGVQGNLDPFLLSTSPEAVAVETKRILSEMKGLAGHVFNLGHGVPPNAKLENIEALVNTVRGAE
jgi:uroporphyrinogen decarboxylase